MISCGKAELAALLAGKRVVIVGSGPGVLDNEPDFIDGHDVVVRVNNWRLSDPTGYRCDVFYSFFGGSIKTSAEECIEAGVKLCMCKCPDAKFMESEWHRRMNKPNGVDFRYIYRDRASWWFCPVYVPSLEEFQEVFNLLDGHIPSTGFSAILAIIEHKPSALHLTGFDFFASRIHNVSEPWRPGNPDDPIGHAPEKERAFVKTLAAAYAGQVITFDKRLAAIMEG
jgi:hypothetical protein